MIKNFFDFDYYLFLEKKHINEDISNISEYIFNNYNSATVGKYIIKDNIPLKLNINKIKIEIVKYDGIFNGSLVTKDCNKNYNGNWDISIKLKENFNLGLIMHEMNHAYELINMGKNNVVKKLDYLKSKNFINIDEQIKNFIYVMYIATDEEINSNVNEAYGYIKDFLFKKSFTKINQQLFINLIKQSPSYQKYLYLNHINMDIIFNNYDNRLLNNFLFFYEKNEIKFKEIRKKNPNLFIQKLIFIYKTLTNEIDNSAFYKSNINNQTFTPKRDIDYYNNYFKKKADRLKRRLLELYTHFS